MRPATTQQNAMNRSKRSNNKSGYSGIYWNNINKKWIAQITINNNPIYLGSFEMIEDAIKTRKEAEQKYFGEFAPQEVFA